MTDLDQQRSEVREGAEAIAGLIQAALTPEQCDMFIQQSTPAVVEQVAACSNTVAVEVPADDKDLDDALAFSDDAWAMLEGSMKEAAPSATPAARSST